jgi:hypothetical protein
VRNKTITAVDKGEGFKRYNSDKRAFVTARHINTVIRM